MCLSKTCTSHYLLVAWGALNGFNAALAAADNDPYVVTFNGNDNPMSPKSMPLLRKWLIVNIVCTGALCVVVKFHPSVS